MRYENNLALLCAYVPFKLLFSVCFLTLEHLRILCCLHVLINVNDRVFKNIA